MTAFLLIHGPLVGPLTWKSLAEEFRRRGVEAMAPALPYAMDLDPPYWRSHADAVAAAAGLASEEGAIVLVGHSGAGMLLPAVRQSLARRVAGYIFVDADIPQDGKSRLDLFESRDDRESFRRAASAGMLPTWTENNLEETIPNPVLRRRFVAELRPLPLAVYEEPISVFEGWPDAPCGYLQFTEYYESSARHAQREGWPYAKIEADHFHMLIDPRAVADALLDLVLQAGMDSDPEPA